MNLKLSSLHNKKKSVFDKKSIALKEHFNETSIVTGYDDRYSNNLN